MPSRRPKATIGEWFANQLWNTSLPWLVGVMLFGIAFYYNTNNRLEQHEATGKRIEEKQDNLQKQITETKKNEITERTKIRDEFLADSKSTATGIAELNKQTAVMGTILSSVKEELIKINSRLDSTPIKR